MMAGKKPKRRLLKSDTAMAIEFANMEDNEPGFEPLVPFHAHISAIYIYIYICVCVCVCVFISFYIFCVPVTNGFQQQQNEMLHAALEEIRSPYQIGHPAGRLPFPRYIRAMFLGPCGCSPYSRLIWMVQPLTMVSEKIMNQFIGFWVLYYALYASISMQVLFDYDDAFQNNARWWVGQAVLSRSNLSLFACIC